jgi:hypothetical protein
VDELREACAEVARRARWVRIDDDAIAGCARSLTPAGEPGPAPDRLSGPARERAAAQWLTLDAINFGSGWFPTLHKPEGSGYATIAAAWRRRLDDDGPWSAAELCALDPATVAETFGQRPGHELMELFTLSLNDLGVHLRDVHAGRFAGPVDAARGSAVALAHELGGWPCFADRSRYEELSLPFLKRAQIAAADLRRAGVAEWGG